uniref:Uncharacterized protein n=1 Tax=Romanomermis culicivorax TaxID=13658 RepID=A0A915HR69_ROMCU
MKFVIGYLCLIFTSVTEAQTCASETQNYISCVYDAKKSIGLWHFRRPYADHEKLNRCFSV